MRLRLGIFAILVIALFSAACVVAVQEPPVRHVYTPPPPPPPPAPAVVDQDYGLFHDDLEPLGRWAWLDPYGWVWTPWGVRADWRPYTAGRWIDTDDGWYWESDEAWGWATYHYGRWTLDPRLGWAWIPGREWAPCWVAWRQGGGWIGWAPLPPGAVWRAGVGLDLGNVDVMIQASWWGFVADRDFLEPRIAVRMVPVERVPVLVRSTPHVTRYGVERDRIVVRGIDPRMIEQARGHAVPRYRVVDDKANEGHRGRAVGQEVRVYRPQIKEGPPSRAPRAAETRPVIPARAQAPQAQAEQIPPQMPGRRAVERRAPPADANPRADVVEPRPAQPPTAVPGPVRHPARPIDRRPMPAATPAGPAPSQPGPPAAAAKPEPGKGPATAPAQDQQKKGQDKKKDKDRDKDKDKDTSKDEDGDSRKTRPRPQEMQLGMLASEGLA